MRQNQESVLSSSIANKIKKRIVQGEWKVNEQLPNEQVLADELLVSRTTIREAVKTLVSKNILRIERGKGTFVANAPGLIDDPLGFEFIQDAVLIKDLCEYRLSVEPYVCALAAQKATTSQLSEMEKIIALMVKLELDLSKTQKKDTVIDRIADIDASFHSLLYHMTQNTIFQRTIAIVNNVIIANYTTALYRSRGQALAFTNTHKALYEAIECRNSDLAFQLGLDHMTIMQQELCRELME